MDIEEYLNQLSKKLDEDLNSIFPLEMNQNVTSKDVDSDSFLFCPHCGQNLTERTVYCPFCGEKLIMENTQSEKIQPLRSLKHYDDFEESTKSKIGTFEKIYNRAFQVETGRPLIQYFGYETMDYAPLVNPLTSALEIELNASVILLLRKKYGKNCQFQVKGKTVDLGNNNNTLRDIQICLEEDVKRSNELQKSGMANAAHCAKDLSHLVSIRNNASHKKEISKETFFSFYGDLFAFFEKYMDDLLALKNEEKHLTGTLPEQQQECTRVGIIFTDSVVLSQKIFGTSDEAGYFVNLFQGPQGYIARMAEFGIRYQLLDVSNYNGFDRNGGWKAYFRLLSNFYGHLSSEYRMATDCTLFIVGGEDVIPMPRVLNPIQIHNDTDVAKMMNSDLSLPFRDYDERVLDSDLLYSYVNNDLSYLRGECWIELSSFYKMNPCLWVGRYPLERGEVETEVEPVSQYLDRVVENMTTARERCANDKNNVALSVGQHVAVVCETLKRSSDIILKGLPYVDLQDIDGVTWHNKFLSPKIDLCKGDTNHLSMFLNEIRKSDMLSFLLHGSNKKSTPSYLGQSATNLLNYYIAITPELIRKTQARFYAGLCCWGARYTGFLAQDSALITAMRNNALLFMGSCRCAFGMFDFPDASDVSITLAQILLKEYLSNLMKGYEAGKALTMAKLSYLRCPDSVSDPFTLLGTILEFNLYGDPFIAVHPQLKYDDEPIEPYISNPNFKSKEYKVVYDRDNIEDTSFLLNKVRNLVDNNLKEIRDRVCKELYSAYHIEQDQLTRIYRYEDQNGESGYRLEYDYNLDKMKFSLKVNTDKTGKIRNVLGTL